MSKHRFRFLGSPSTSNPDVWEIADGELDHIVKVLKLKVSDAVEVFDGSGRSCFGPILSISKLAGLVKNQSERMVDRDKNQLFLILGVLDFKKMDQLIPQLVELGLHQLTLFNSSKQNRNRLNDKTTERWGKIILESCKQSKRDFLMNLSIKSSLLEAIQEASAADTKLLLDPQAKTHLSKSFDHNKEGATAILLGPEKGLLSEEVERAKINGYKPASLGPHILRSVTAAVVATALYQA